MLQIRALRSLLILGKIWLASSLGFSDHKSNSLQEDLPLYPDTLFWHRANQSLLVRVIIYKDLTMSELFSGHILKNLNLFSGRRCKTDIDECESQPCQYNGTCVDGINNYTCSCIPGITGRNCEIDINECESNPCQNGGQCHDRING